LTPSAAAAANNLSRKTFIRRQNGGKSRAEGKENQQSLCSAEEKSLARYITRGFI